jgi:predicted ABC-class ATPase
VVTGTAGRRGTLQTRPTPAAPAGPALELRKGERVKRVEGQENYVEIVSGAREGMFVNTSGNARHGQAFVRSIKDGVEQHIYGSGDDRVVVSNEKS